MKKIFIAFIALILLSSASLVVDHTASDNYFWKGTHKFVNVPKVCNSGGTVTDTLETKAAVRLKLDKSTFTTYQADTVTLSTAIPAAVYSLPTYSDNTTALAALGVGRLYKNSSGQVFITY